MIVAFIPARGGSERVPGKNAKKLNGQPLIAYAIAGAVHSKVFDKIYVTTDDPKIMAVSIKHGAEVIKRPIEYSRADSPDYQWIIHAAATVDIDDNGICFILPPTNPFRTAFTIRRAMKKWEEHGELYHSMRSVSPAENHPNKCWHVQGEFAIPWGHDLKYGLMQCDSPTQMLVDVWTQNGCIRIFTMDTLMEFRNPTGLLVLPFITNGYEGINIDTIDDWQYAEYLARTGKALLEPIDESAV